MKNAHGVEPTRYMKKENSNEAISCYHDYGPVLGYDDIAIGDNCNEEGSCLIPEPSNFQYECHPEYKSSLYVNTDGPDYSNFFSVLDYEVYTH